MDFFSPLNCIKLTSDFQAAGFWGAIWNHPEIKRKSIFQNPICRLKMSVFKRVWEVCGGFWGEKIIELAGGLSRAIIWGVLPQEQEWRFGSFATNNGETPKKTLQHQQKWCFQNTIQMCFLIKICLCTIQKNLLKPGSNACFRRIFFPDFHQFRVGKGDPGQLKGDPGQLNTQSSHGICFFHGRTQVIRYNMIYVLTHFMLMMVFVFIYDPWH